MREEACEIHCADLVSVKSFKNDALQLTYLAFRTGRHNFYLERELLQRKIRVELKLDTEEDLVVAPLGVQSWLHLKCFNIIK